MSEIRLVQKEGVAERSEQRFTDLTDRLENALIDANSLSDIEQLLVTLSHAFQEPWLNFDQKLQLKRVRQRIYDRRKNFKFAESMRDQFSVTEEASIKPSLVTPMKKTEQDNDIRIDLKLERSVMRVLHRIDVEQIMLAAPAFVLSLSIAILTTWLLWQQSVPLYQSSGFNNPSLVVFGALLMMVGFAAIHSATKSKLALLFCVYICSYEVYFIITATLNHESVAKVEKSENSPELLLLKEQMNRASEAYKLHKIKFEDPNSKMFQNSWYKEKFLDPAMQTYSASTHEFTQRNSEIISKQAEWDKGGLLKILYRLGLVFLCMMSVHRFMKFQIYASTRPQ